MPGTADRRRRFLAAYRELPVVAPAARLAGVSRQTVYKWLNADPAFAADLRAAAEAFFEAHAAAVRAADAERQRRREASDLRHRAARQANLARARSFRRAAPAGK